MTTHDWTTEVDTEHLADIRARPDHFGEGGRRHLLLEVLAHAADEAEELGRSAGWSSRLPLRPPARHAPPQGSWSQTQRHGIPDAE